MAKLQELKNLLKLLESLSLQRTHNQQVFEAEQLGNAISLTEYEADKAFYIHFSQGLVNLGRVGVGAARDP